MDYQIELQDGTIIQGIAACAQGFLWLYFKGYTMQQAATLFLDEEKTGHITFTQGEAQTDYEGFTDCRVIQIDADGNNSVCMARGAANG